MRRPILSLYWNNITQEKFCDLHGSIISKLKEINYDLLTADEWEWLYFFFGGAEFSQNYNCLIIILSNAREFLNRKTIKMCKKGRLLYESQYLSYPFISYSAQSNYNKPSIKISKW